MQNLTILRRPRGGPKACSSSAVNANRHALRRAFVPAGPLHFERCAQQPSAGRAISIAPKPQEALPIHERTGSWWSERVNVLNHANFANPIANLTLAAR